MRRLLTCWAVIITVVMVFPLTAQDTEVDTITVKTNLISITSEVRSHWLSRRKNKLIELAEIVDEYLNDSLVSNESKFKFKTFKDSLLSKPIYSSSDIKIWNFSRGWENGKTWAKGFLKIEAHLIATYRHLSNMYRFGLIDEESPYKISFDKEAIETWSLLSHIDPRQPILDLGAGMGTLSILLSRKYPNTEVVANEIKKNRIKYIKFEKRSQETMLNNLYTLKGSKKNIGKTNKTFGTVIMRNTLHHLKRPKHIFKDLREHTFPNCKIFIIEELYDENEKKNCKHSFTYGKLHKELAQHYLNIEYEYYDTKSKLVYMMCSWKQIAD